MRHPRGRSRNLLITIVVAVLICVPTGIAIAAPAPADPAVEQACSNRYDEESLGYQACLQAATESPPATTTLITAIDGYQPDTPPAASDDSTVVQYCDTGNGTYRTGAADCPRPITCTRQADTGKYQCLDPTGIPINPPGDICERSPAYVCTYTSSLTSEQLTAGQSAPLPTDLPSPPPAATTSQSAAPQPTSTAPTPDPTLTPTPAPTPTPTSTATPTDPVGQSVQQANALNMRIWLEGDLTAAWREGAASLAAAVKRLSAHAAQPGVIGVKFAHDLGLTGFPPPAPEPPTCSAFSPTPSRAARGPARRPQHRRRRRGARTRMRPQPDLHPRDAHQVPPTHRARAGKAPPGRRRCHQRHRRLVPDRLPNLEDHRTGRSP
ncbi:hypothetical protein ACFQX6_67405 [Streptosporangium lutulentum]